MFREQGFAFSDNTTAIPCGTVYHLTCYHAGPPFKTRLPNNKGLHFPQGADPTLFPNFTCEACQVRAVLDRELRTNAEDIHLLRLERMRMLDIMNRLAEGSMRTYKYPLRRIQTFEGRFGVHILRPTPMAKPSTSPCIPLMWAQLDHTLQPGKQAGSTVKFSSARGVRSAVSTYYQFDLAMSRPAQAMSAGKGDKSWVTNHVVPTDEMIYTHFNTGLKRRMGDRSTQSTALKYTHLKFLDECYQEQYSRATTDADRHEAATAGTVNLVFWLGWLRSREGFSLERQDVTQVAPNDGPRVGLPRGVGLVALRLLPETKTNPSRTADVIIAHTCWSGLSLGTWLERLLPHAPAYGNLLFSTKQQPIWTSQYFRRQHVWPHLERLRLMGDPSMATFSNQDGQSVMERIYSMHTWRRGADTFAQQYHPMLQARKALLDEIYEHGRWKRSGRSEEMHIHYREWDLPRRICLTQFCM